MECWWLDCIFKSASIVLGLALQATMQAQWRALPGMPGESAWQLHWVAASGGLLYLPQPTSPF